MQFPSDLQAHIGNLVISDTQPDNALQDFKRFLTQVAKSPVPLTKGKKQPTQKWAAALDKELSQPVKLTLMRPLTQHYATVLGLYLLSRSSGLCRIVKKKTNMAHLEINTDMLAQWQNMSPAEQYFSLLEAWLIRGHPSLIGEHLSGRDNRFLGCAGVAFLRKDVFSIEPLEEQWFEYLPKQIGNYNLTILKLLGLANLALTNNSNHLASFQLTPFDVTLFNACQKTVDMGGLHIPMGVKDELYEEDEFLNAVRHSRPDIHKTLQLPEQEIAASYLLKVSLCGYKCHRTLAVSAEHTLDELALGILDAFSFDNDHLYYFQYQDAYGFFSKIVHPDMDGEYFTDENRLKHLNPEVGDRSKFIFDLGDQWEFDILVSETMTARQQLIEITDQKGELPEQYPSCDED